MRHRHFPLILSFSRRTRLGEFANQSDRIRKRMRCGRRDAVASASVLAGVRGFDVSRINDSGC